MLRRSIITVTLLALGSWSAFAQIETPWITEQEMKRLSAEARTTGEVLTRLSCKFEDVPNPSREHVRFQPTFVQGDGTQPWGWTYEANAANPGTDATAKRNGFKLIHVDQFEVSGVTWVRCKVWHR